MDFKLDLDRNGNKIIKIKPTNARGFCLQTNGNLPTTHTMTDINDPHIVLAEIAEYVTVYGTKRQKALVGAIRQPDHTTSP